MRIGHNSARLADALRDLRQAWSRAGDGWRDQAREEFAQAHLEPLEQRVREAVDAMAELARILERTIRDCQ